MQGRNIGKSRGSLNGVGQRIWVRTIWAFFFFVVKFGVSLSNCGDSPSGQVMLVNRAWSKRWAFLRSRIEFNSGRMFTTENKIIIVGLGQGEEASLSAREAGTLS